MDFENPGCGFLEPSPMGCSAAPWTCASAKDVGNSPHPIPSPRYPCFNPVQAFVRIHWLQHPHPGSGGKG